MTPSTRRHRRDPSPDVPRTPETNSDDQHERDAQHPPRERRARGPSTERPHLRQVGLDRYFQTGTEHRRQHDHFEREHHGHLGRGRGGVQRAFRSS